MSNSNLVTYTKLSPNHSGKRTHVIDTITIHHMAGNLDVVVCGNIFANTARQASSNYGVHENQIGLYVDEANRSWCSSNRENDQRAITIEVSNDTAGVKNKTWTVSDTTYKTLIKLLVDICKRNGIKQLIWSNNKSDRVNRVNGCNMTVHQDFAATMCPGPYLYSKMADIAKKVNEELFISNTVDVKPTTPTTTTKLYRPQVGAYKVKANADKMEAKLKADGFKTYVTKVGDLYKVQTGAYKEKKNADAEVAKLKNKKYTVYLAYY